MAREVISIRADNHGEVTQRLLVVVSTLLNCTIGRSLRVILARVLTDMLVSLSDSTDLTEITELQERLMNKASKQQLRQVSTQLALKIGHTTSIDKIFDVCDEYLRAPLDLASFLEACNERRWQLVGKQVSHSTVSVFFANKKEK